MTKPQSDTSDLVQTTPSITVGGWVAQNVLNILVGGVLAQSAHDVGHLVVGHLAVTNSVKETKSLLEVWTDEETKERSFELYGLDTSRDEKIRLPVSSNPIWAFFVCDSCAGSLN